MGMKYPVMLRHLGLKRVLLGDASFDWWLALEWLVPVTNSQTEQVGSSLVPLMCLVERSPWREEESAADEDAASEAWR